jgi:hypothetical protein
MSNGTDPKEVQEKEIDKASGNFASMRHRLKGPSSKHVVQKIVINDLWRTICKTARGMVNWPSSGRNKTTATRQRPDTSVHQTGLLQYGSS